MPGLPLLTLHGGLAKDLQGGAVSVKLALALEDSRIHASLHRLHGFVASWLPPTTGKQRTALPPALSGYHSPWGPRGLPAGKSAGPWTCGAGQRFSCRWARARAPPLQD